MSINIIIPEKIAKKARELGLDIEALVLELLVERLPLDPKEEVMLHLELSRKYLEEGEKLIDRDVVQASEKLYKAVEEAVKAFAKHLNMKEILARVKERGRWTVTDLERVVRVSAKRIDRDILIGWGEANYLHVWGFHEAKLDAEAVRTRLPYIKRTIETLEKVVSL